MASATLTGQSLLSGAQLNRAVASAVVPESAPDLSTEACPTAGRDVLKLGDGSILGCESIRQLQKLLADNGYALGIDGEFGASTETAVRQFQSNAGLLVDGLVGPATWAALLGSVGDY